ncbi:nitrogenase cofactor biosynthesis protein NifB [Candidatus Moduliflexus flocculans]|uniref:FeMo cofactor biosynthesis protein NifB n=1 Tax=Candidatus Moduliflexus flocculans TaxID=1499966 RepID=A0A081BPX3_9BACT|nr:nitrogenase cofactor biosynthesis protein NifB [Candidatus Moduliflexus flocculans]
MELFEKHPCFNDTARHRYARIHLPVAPRCNVQCKFCNRKYDCVNESRPGVTSGVLSPHQALAYLDEVMQRQPNIAVVGIAGPGDPFANSDETMETLRLVNERYPDMLLCVATNGLNIGKHIEELARLNISHVTLTINAIDPKIGAQIYAWVRYGKRVYPGEEGATILLMHQLEALQRLKEKGMTVKVNSIILPGINETHIAQIAEKVASLRADIFNCIPYYKNAGSAFEHLDEPSKDAVHAIRAEAAQFLPQMAHCTRCRADAVGLLGEGTSSEFMKLLQQYEAMPKELAIPVAAKQSDRPYIAVASMEGMLVNQHLGEAEQLLIYSEDGLIEKRKTPESGGGMLRWQALAAMLDDCRALLVSGIGKNPQDTLKSAGVNVMVVEGMIDDAVSSLFKGEHINHLAKRQRTVCGEACSGTGGGCG